ncbi:MULTISPECIES: ATP-binding protein [unclassified Microcoleus]|uniref:ATP-binding protein n=1 Tax=unclassified Microcoleus TaxID=2642155 RepID=UPI002FCEB967
MRYNDETPSLGIGLKIISQIADELSYTRNSYRRNCLSIVKYYQPVLPQHSTQAGGLKRSSDVLNIFNWLKEQITSQSDRNSNQPLQKITIQLNSEMATVSQVLWWVEQLDNLPIPETVLQLARLAVVEGFILAVHHHKNMPSETSIDLSIAVFNERLEINIWDWGKPFNFKAKLNEELEKKDPFCLKHLEFVFE